MIRRSDEIAHITLGGRPHEIAAFTLDELQEVLPLLEELGPAKSFTERMAVSKRILAKALRRDEAAIGGMRMSIDEVIDAVDVALEVSGLKRLGEKLAATRAKTAG